MSIWSWLKRRRPGLDDEDFEEEIRAHLAIAEHDRVEAGADRESARVAARRDFGNLTLTAEAARRVWTPRWLDALRDAWSDARLASRSLARSPGFSLIVVAVLALGISLNAAVFAVLKGLTLTPLPGVARSAQLHVVVRESTTGRQHRLSYPDFQFLRDHAQSFTGLMGTMFRLEQYRLGEGKGSRTLSVEFVTGNYFQVLGVKAALGRTLLPSDELEPGRHPFVVLGHGLWQREFGSDPTIVGRTVDINRNRLTVVGVADAAFHGTVPVYDVEAFIPITMAPEVGIAGFDVASNLLSNREASLLVAHGFLRTGVSPDTAAAETDNLAVALARERPITTVGERFRILPFWQSPIGPQTYLVPMLTVLTAMGSLVLLIVCANIAGLVLARGVSRRGELAARLALGASRTRVIRLLVVENLVLVVPGTAIGILVAQRAVRILIPWIEALAEPQRLFFNIDVDALTLGFAVLIAVLCALVFGLVPALQTSRVDLVQALNEDASPRAGTSGRLRAALVTAQVAVSLVLLVGAGLVMRGLDLASQVDPGFDADRITTIALDLQPHGYVESRGREFYSRLLDKLRGDATMESAAMAAYDPLNFLDLPVERVAIDGYEPGRDEELAMASNTVSTDYFQTLRIALIAGRSFEDRDNDTAPPVTIVNRTLAERFWQSPQAALGKRIRVADGAWRMVVGVVGDLKYVRLNESERPYFYVPFSQAYRPAMVVYARSAAATQTVVGNLRSHVAALDPDLAGDPVRLLSDVRRIALLGYRLTAVILLVFGAAGMTLAALGTYGLVSYTVRQHTREIGIRIAMGATGISVVRAFLRRSLRLGVTGGGIGTLVAFVSGRLLGSALYGVSLIDALSFAQALGIVIGGIIIATFIPAWRASRMNPAVALRHD